MGSFEHRRRPDPHATILVVTATGEDPAEMLAAAGAAIVAGVERAGPGWAAGEVDRILDAWGRVEPTRRDGIRDDARRAGSSAAIRVVHDLRTLLALPPATQAATPLEVVRTIVREPTALLRGLGVPEVVRDPFDERAHPDDVYDLAPRTLADLEPGLGPELLVWGMAKARLMRAPGQTGRPDR
jgi:hypothetical protein